MTDLRKLASVTEIRALTAKDLGRNLDAMTPARIANRGLKNWNGSTQHEGNMTAPITTNTAEIDKPLNN
jgi:hypothetical protein